MDDKQQRPDGRDIRVARDDAPVRRPDASRLSADELLARPAPLPSAGDEPGVADKLREGLARAGEAVREGIDKADIPARLAKLELGDKARSAGRVLGAAGRKAIDGGGRAARTAASAAAKAASRTGDAAAPKLKAAADSARSALNKGATSAREGLGEGRAKVQAAAARAALQVGGSIRREAEPPPSELDRLLAEEAEADQPKAAATTTAAAGLPLFAEQPRAMPVASAPAKAAPSPTPATDRAATSDPAATPAAAAQAATPAPAVSARPSVTAAPAVDQPPPPSRPVTTIAVPDMRWWQQPAALLAGGAAMLALGFAGGSWLGGGSSDAEVGRIVEAYLLEHPDILPRAMERLEANRAAEAIRPIRAQLTRAFSGAWAGNPDGDVTLVVFTDYACTFCRASMNDIERLLREDRNLKIVYREFPILSPESEAAARLALVAAQRGRYQPMHRALFMANQPDSDGRAAAASQVGVTADAAALNAGTISAELDSNRSFARALGINGTPTWIVGDRLMTGAVGYQALRQAIAEARSAG